MAKRGRKSLAVEVDTNKLFSLSYHTLHKALKSDKVSQSKKIDIALAIYTKHLPSKLEHSGKVDADIFISIDETMLSDKDKEGFNATSGRTK